MKLGFVLRELTVSGPSLPNAVVRFTRGLNVIAGPSDTGKTYIFQCLDYVLGGSSPPKTIPEAKDYDTVRLSLHDRDAREYVLERSLRGGDIRISSAGAEDRVLAAKHAANDPDTLSAFLLGLSGFADKRVRTNASGKTRSLSFRDLSRLTLVDEESVMTARSPALSGQFVNETVESRVFRLLLTGEDDSSVIANEDPKFANGKRTGQVELLQRLIARAHDARQDGEVPESIEAAESGVAAIQAVAEDASNALRDQQQAAVPRQESDTTWRV